MLLEWCHKFGGYHANPNNIMAQSTGSEEQSEDESIVVMSRDDKKRDFDGKSTHVDKTEFTVMQI